MSKKNHTPAPWIHDKRAFGSRITAPKMDVHYANGDIPCVARVFRHKQAKGIKHYLDDIEADANAELIASAPIAPHECDDPKCPGNINRQKLEMFDDLVRWLESCSEILERNAYYSTVKYLGEVIENAKALQEASKCQK